MQRSASRATDVPASVPAVLARAWTALHAILICFCNFNSVFCDQPHRDLHLHQTYLHPVALMRIACSNTCYLFAEKLQIGMKNLKRGKSLSIDAVSVDMVICRTTDV